MTLYIYDKDGKRIKTFTDVKPHGLKTMFLGYPKRQVLMFNHKFGCGSIDIVNGMTFGLYGKSE